jgi:hypothetical protein
VTYLGVGARLRPSDGAPHAVPKGDHASKMPAVRSAGAACERQRDRLDSFGYGLAAAARQQHHRHDHANGAEHRRDREGALETL